MSWSSESDWNTGSSTVITGSPKITLGFKTDTANPSEPTDNFVAWWPLNDTSDGIAEENSRDGYDGILNGGIQDSAGPGSTGGYAFDGSDDWINMTDKSSYSPRNTGGITVTGWIRPDNGTYTNDIIGVWGDTKTTQEWLLGTYGENDFRIYIRDENGNFHSVVTKTDAPEYGEWYHFSAIIDDDGTLKLYINGTLIKEKTVSLNGGLQNDAGSILEVGSEFGGSKRFFNGQASSFRIYNKILSNESIRNLNTAPREGTVTTDTKVIGENASLSSISLRGTLHNDSSPETVTVTVYTNTNSTEAVKFSPSEKSKKLSNITAAEKYYLEVSLDTGSNITTAPVVQEITVRSD